MKKAEKPADGGTFDYIVIGAGSSGAVIAARLSEDPAVSVCLIEAGPADTNPLIHIPFGLAFLMRFKSTDWGYETVPQPGLDGRMLYWPRGRTLGGSSSLNAMIYIRGVPADYDGWAEMGAKGWDWQSLLPYFKKAEDQEHGADELHGAGGPLSVRDLRHVSPLSHAFSKAGAELQIRQTSDFNGPAQEGLGLYQVTQRNGQRCSTAVAYLGPARTRKNLAIYTRTRTEKIFIENGRATGVNVKSRGQVRTISARREVICCGGAINTPQLLMLSGLGPARHLQEHGIPVISSLPGAGQNLQDHLDVMVQGSTNSMCGYGIVPSILPRGVWALFNYALRRRGFLTSNVAEAGGFIRIDPNAPASEVQYHFLPTLMKDHGRKTVFGYGYGVHTCCLRPESRGEIRLVSRNPSVPPLINPRYLSSEYDVRTMIEGVRIARRILAAPAFSRFRGRELEPGEQAQTDEELHDFIRRNAETIYHPVGTCRMGAADDPASVVDPELRVIGVEGLRVADASVMPALVRGNTNAPAIMIGEKAADLIRADAKR